MFAGTYTGGVFKTTNNGLNWTQIINGLSVQYIFSLTASGINLFAGTDQGLFLTTNYGNNWIARNTGISNKYVNSILIKDSNIFIATSEYASGGGVFLSTNNGINWTQAGLNEKAISSLTAIGNFLFAGTYEGVYRSSNNGNNWLAVNNGLTGLNVKKLISWGNLLIAGFDTYPFGGGVYATTNYGDSWINTNSGFYNIPSIYSCLITDNIILAGTYGQSVWRRPLSEIIGIKNISSEVPEGFELGQNYPNPFNANTIIRFQIGIDSRLRGNDKVVLRVYDLMGREVRTLVDERLEAGVYEVRFDAGELPSGVYFYRMEAGSFMETRKLVLLK